MFPFRLRLLTLASERFREVATAEQRGEFERFSAAEAHWLEDYALFMALKEAYDGLNLQIILLLAGTIALGMAMEDTRAAHLVAEKIIGLTSRFESPIWTLAGVYLTTMILTELVSNAATRLADGGGIGRGAEFGNEPGKMHARGPVGAEQLPSFKYVVEGDGTVRP